MLQLFKVDLFHCLALSQGPCSFLVCTTSHHHLTFLLLISRTFTDELLTVYVAFETVAEGKTARELADCISVGLDLRAYGNAPKSVSVSEDTAERSPSRNEDIIWSGNIQSDVEPYVLLEKASSERAKATLIWTCTVEISKEASITVACCKDLNLSR